MSRLVAIWVLAYALCSASAAMAGSFWLTLDLETEARASEYATGKTYLTGCSVDDVQYLSTASRFYRDNVVFTVAMTPEGPILRDLHVAEGGLGLAEDFDAQIVTTQGSVQRSDLGGDRQEIEIRLVSATAPNAFNISAVTLYVQGTFRRQQADQDLKLSKCPSGQAKE